MILFTDLDGTLFNDNKEFTSGNRDAINRALDQGHQVVISTGRPLVSAKLQAETLQLDREGCYVIAFMIFLPERAFTKKRFPWTR